MINPSVFGWIDKFFVEQKSFEVSDNEDALYRRIRNTGFMYGHIVSFSFDSSVSVSNLRSEEVSKIAFLSVLYDVFCFRTKEKSATVFVESLVCFYEEMQNNNKFILNFGRQSNSQKLEDIIGVRVKTNKDLISKNFSPIVTNALLFIDVLAFQKYLIEGDFPYNYMKRIEELLLHVVSFSLSVKQEKSSNDSLLIKLFESSVRYTKINDFSRFSSISELPFDLLEYPFEKYYVLDLAGLSMWNDGMLDGDEHRYIVSLAEKIGVETGFVTQSIASIDAFILKYKSEIKYFKNSNPVKHFYDQTTDSVAVLVKRNKSRLTKELVESKELLYLLGQATRRDLDKDEKKKVKKQLLDICKSIPSLTIFLLPGGGLLLPILIKFIPQLLPSAFNENLED